MTSEAGSWCLIESDPGVFWELALSLGVANCQFEELTTIESESFDDLTRRYGEVLGLIFLFPFKKTTTGLVAANEEVHVPPGLFFAHQVVGNACATQAMLSVLMNVDKVELGPTLTSFRDFTLDFPPELKGIALGAEDTIRTAHNAFAPSPYLITAHDDTHKGPKEDPYHYVAFVPHGQNVYMLDGLRQGPVKMAPQQQQNPLLWWQSCLPCIRGIMNHLCHPTNNSADIRFNLIAVVPDNLKRLDRLLADPTLDLSMTHELEQLKLNEIAKRTEWKEENVWRKHDLTHFLICALKYLGKNDKLLPAYTRKLCEKAAQYNDGGS